MTNRRRDEKVASTTRESGNNRLGFREGQIKSASRLSPKGGSLKIAIAHRGFWFQNVGFPWDGFKTNHEKSPPLQRFRRSKGLHCGAKEIRTPDLFS